MICETVAATLLSTFFGVAGTGVGGLFGALLGRRGRGFLPALFNLSGGMMVAVVCFELLPQAYAIHVPLAALGFFLGVASVMAMSAMLERCMGGDGTDERAMRRTGWLVLLSLALHNMPEGLAIGSGLAAQTQLGLMLGVMIMLHDVPEGIASSMPLCAGGMQAARAFLLTLASGLPTGLGALAGFLLGGVSLDLIALSFGLAAGAMLQVTAGELLPRAKEQGQSAADTLFLSLGIAVGSVITLIV